MSIVEYEGPPSWSLDASETGGSTKCPWVGELGLKSWGCTPTHGYFVLSPVSLASIDDRHLRSRKNRGL